LNYTRRGYLSL